MAWMDARAPLGAWTGSPSTLRRDPPALADALADLARPVFVVRDGSAVAIATAGLASPGRRAADPDRPLLGWAPALLPEGMGHPGFLAAHGVRYALVGGAMANAIASEDYVEALARAGFLAFFGSAGPSLERIEAAIDRLGRLGLPHGFNLIHSPDEPEHEAATVDLFLRRGVRTVSASAYMDLTLPVVRFRAAGLRQDGAGVLAEHRILAKVSRAEVARRFLSPAPARMLAELVERGEITAEQARLAASVPLADDVTAEADSGGHTDNRPLLVLLPELLALRDRLAAEFGYSEAPRIGAAGGIATPASAAAAFALGAAYVVTGSVNQACREAGTSDAVRELLAQASPSDVTMAPAADMFEMGVQVQVLSKGTLFAVRARRLHELYRRHDRLDDLPEDDRAFLEKSVFRGDLDAAWEQCAAFWRGRDPERLARAEADPKDRMALLFRSYLGQASRWANAGVADRRLDFQIWCGPSMGAFNDWAQGSPLERWQDRDVVTVSRNLLAGAAALTRAAALKAQGLDLPAGSDRIRPLDADAMAARFDRWRSAEAEGLIDSSTPHPVGPRRTAEDPIAIVGMGCIFPKAPDLQAFWRLLREGIDAVGEVPDTHWALADYGDEDPSSPDRTYGLRGAFLDPVDFDPTEFGIPPNILEATDTSQLLGLLVARQALADAGYPVDGAWDWSRASVVLGVTGTQELVINLGARLGHPHWWKSLRDAGVDEATAQRVVDGIGRRYVQWQENSFPGLLGNVVAGRIANRFDFGGTNCVLDAACASSLAALHLACMELQRGKADLVLTGGVDALNDVFMHMCFSKTPALSATGDVRPFSDQGDGTVLGEGLGMVVLKRLADAERDGDRVYAVIRGVGTASDGKAKSIYAPRASGQARALRDAYEDAGVTPRDLQLLEAHGTGTKAGDVTEFEGLRDVFGDAEEGPWCALGSVKSQIGHTKAAAGAAGLIKASLALHHKVLPPTLKVDRPNPKMAIERSAFYLPDVARPWIAGPGPRRAGVSSFGFGGSDYHVVLEEHRPQASEPAWDGSVEIVPLCAPDAASLTGALAELDPSTLVEQARAWRQRFDRSAPHRLVLVLDGDLDAVRERALARLQAEPDAAWSIPGAHRGLGGEPGRIAFVFSGQGSQYVGMGRGLATVFPEVAEALGQDSSVAADVLPPRTFDASLRSEREERLRRTDRAQPALGAFGAGLIELLRRFGVVPDLAAGHSYGELLALHTAGVLDRSGLRRASELRGRLMAGDGEDRGGMLAVLAPLERIERLLVEEGLDLVLANRNTPEQGVLSGARGELLRAEAACVAAGLRVHPLPVGAAFHSPLVADAEAAFRAGLEDIAFSSPRLPVMADATAAEYPGSPTDARDLLASQLARPVRWVEVIEELASRGATAFVEVGPKAALAGMVGRILPETTALAVDASAGRRPLRDLADLLARLASAGHAVDLGPWQRRAPAPRSVAAPPRVPRMVVPISGANLKPSDRPMPSIRKPTGLHFPPVGTAPMSREQAPAPAPGLAAAALPSRPLGGPPRSAGPSSPSAAASPSASAPPSRLVAPPSTAPRLASPPPPRSEPTMAQESADPSLLLLALQAAQGQLEALQSMQQQTAEIHRRFLEGQQASQASFQSLVDGQQRLLEAALTGGVSASPAFSSAGPASARPSGVVSASPVAPFSTVAPLAAPGPPPSAVPAASRIAAAAAPRSAASVAPPPSAPAALPSSGLRARVVPTLLAVVAESTGYPETMLELDMDIESDLGIDSIKRVEILSLFTERMPEAPAVQPEALGRLHTLRQVADFVSAGLPTEGPPELPSAASSPAANADPTGVLLEVVSELTGYPVAMLELDQDLESDLGIDSIKRVEILSLLSDRLPGAPAVEPEHLGQLHTLRQVVAFLADAAPTSPPPSVAAAGPTVLAPPASATPASAPEAAEVLLGVVSELTGYPVAMLDLDQDLESDLGIDSIKRVEILSLLSDRLPGAPVVEPENLGGLHTLRQVLDFLAGATPGAPKTSAPTPTKPPPSTTRRAVRPRLAGPLPEGTGALSLAPGREVWVVDDGTDLVAALVGRLEAAGHAVRAVHRAENNGGLPDGPCGALLLLDGHEGRGEPWAPESEAALKDAFALVRAVAPRLRSAGESGGALLACITRLDGELGHAGTAQDPLQLGLAGLAKTAALEWPEVRGLVLDVEPAMDAAAAAAAVHGALLDEGPQERGLRRDGVVVLDLVPGAPVGSGSALRPGGLAVVTGGARGVTAACLLALARRLPQHVLLLGRSPQPEAEPAWLAAAQDEGAVKRALLEHGGNGTRPTPREVGRASQQALAAREIRATLAELESLGSTVEYCAVDVRDRAAVASAVERARRRAGPVQLLVHGAGVLRDRRIEDKTADDFDAVFDTKVGGLGALLRALGDEVPAAVALFTSVSGRFGRRGQVDYAMANEALVGVAASLRATWPASRVVAFDWGPWQGGMVTPSLAAQFTREGIGLLSLEAGADAFVADLLASPEEPVEVVVGSGLDEAPLAPSEPIVTPWVVDPAWPVLRDHRLDGRPVLPAALVAEAFVAAAQRASGADVLSLDRLRVLQGVALEQAPFALEIVIEAAGPGAWQLLLRDGAGRARYSAAATTGVRRAGPPPTPRPSELRPWELSPEETRRTRLFHGPLLAAIDGVSGVGESGIVASLRCAPPPEAWMPGREAAWAVDPLILDGVFQAAILWCWEELGAPSLPSSFDRLVLHGPLGPGPVEVRLHARSAGRGSLRADVELVGADGLLLARVEGYRATASAALIDAFGCAAPGARSEAAAR